MRRLIAPVLPSPGWGASGCLWGCDARLHLFIGRGKDTPRSLRSPPHTASRALLLVTEVLLPPMAGSLPAPVLSAAARKRLQPLDSPRPCPPLREVEEWP